MVDIVQHFAVPCSIPVMDAVVDIIEGDRTDIAFAVAVPIGMRFPHDLHAAALAAHQMGGIILFAVPFQVLVGTFVGQHIGRHKSHYHDNGEQYAQNSFFHTHFLLVEFLHFC